MNLDVKKSFDIFDTTLTRLFARPTDLFYELGNKLREKQLISVSSEEWMEIRIESETIARNFSSNGEVTLPQIYKYVKETIQWSDNPCELAMKMEIEMEQRYLKPIPYIQKKVMDLHNNGKSIIYISDTYFSQRISNSF
jgi:Predicted hydrolase (HAD superfamily)